MGQNRAAGVDPLGPVFISYRQSDGMEIATELAWALRSAGIPVWHDQTDLPPGDTKRRLQEALASGLSGAVLLITPEIEHSEVIRDIELPCLLDLEDNSAFTLAVGSVVEVQDGSGALDYSAPDQLLKQEPETLERLNQQKAAGAKDRAALAISLSRRRMMQLRTSVKKANGMLVLDIQTRVPPSASQFDGDLVLRLRPPAAGERRPHASGIEDLSLFLGQLPELLTIAGADAIRVRGGAHLSVACALGAAIPTTFIGRVEVVDTQGHIWTLTGQAPTPGRRNLLDCAALTTKEHERGPVLVYVDLLPQRSDAAFRELTESRAATYAGIAHLRPQSANLLDSEQADFIVGEINDGIRSFADSHNTTEVHLLLRCPYPIAVLLGRTLNTLTVHIYEWEDSPIGGSSASPRYVPSMVLRSGSGGSPIHAITARRTPPVVASDRP